MEGRPIEVQKEQVKVYAVITVSLRPSTDSQLQKIYINNSQQPICISEKYRQNDGE